ncbi:hypothetical protein TRSA_18210 [Treponema saccharophilum]|uniref:DUF262 domain-containing protein n=1 Tax=Treponema saccharophilum DSM 2985 TaxID=907348 RepID=H7EJN4_9SPIR|nr:protein of unknown function DUF262 [Treponema saccharophilum DSM 2985]BDC96722.1 hypothetical protein TRSA_18210 [Treponema saccharophilum]
MEARTTIRKMLAGNYISVPKYQRAYAWDSDKQVKQFFARHRRLYCRQI